MKKLTTLIVLAGAMILAGSSPGHAQLLGLLGTQPALAQVVALDECDPATFNDPAVGGADFCKNIALGYSTTFPDLLASINAGTPDPGWDFEPDQMSIKKGTVLSVANEGGEEHTFTEVANFGGGFITDLNHGQSTAPECVGGFSTVKVARSRVLSGSHLEVAGLSKGKHFFQCCIHPWMRIEVDVK